MIKRTNTNLRIRSSLALALALALWTPIQSQSAEHAEGKKMMEEKMMERCQKMMDQKQNRMDEMKAQDGALTEQVAKMNRASADKKTEMMAAILTQMVEQRVAMHAHMGNMQADMMQHMSQHMQMGKESMAQCPMMNGRKGMDKKSKDSHKAQPHE